MAEERPVDATKEWMVLHIVGAVAGAKPFVWVTLQKVPH